MNALFAAVGDLLRESIGVVLDRVLQTTLWQGNAALRRMVHDPTNLFDHHANIPLA